MPWQPSREGEVPTLGWAVLDWLVEFLAAPDKPSYEPFVPTREQAEFILRWYELDPQTGRRRYRRGVISRPKGWGKSPLLSALAVAEALAPVVPDGWDARGQPVGKPWYMIRTPLVQIAAVSEDQTRNAWLPLLEMVREGPVCDEYSLEALNTFVNLPRGRIEFVTASAASREGNRPVFVVLDQTESWVPSNGGVKLAATMRRNLGKTGGTSIESPNAFVPGNDSVAEASAAYWQQILEGRATDTGLHYDHREWPPDTDMADRGSLLAGLAYVYGDAAESAGGWVDLERIAAEIHDPSTSPQDARAFYGNQVTHASDAWLAQPEWAGCADLDKVVADGDMITLGFDGSRRRAKGVTDATALIGCRVEDGHLFQIGVWEQPDGPAGRDWEVPRAEVDAAVRMAMDRFKVVGFFADPAKWETTVASWEAAWGPRLLVKATQHHPVEYWMSGGRVLQVVRATEQLHTAIVERDMTHDGSYALTRHCLNARRRANPQGITIAKDHPDSSRKIDGAVASILAWQARVRAIAMGLGKAREQKKAVGF